MTDSLKLTSSGAARPGSGDDDFKERALIFRAKRHELIASNIANADTPNYRALDASFSDSLREAARQSAINSPALASTSAGHIARSELQPSSTLSFARFVQPAQTNLDSNSVDMDRERGAFAQNAILYQLAVSSLDDEYKEFKQASSDPRR